MKSPYATIVIKDCTGQYLRFDGIDYPICNTKAVKDFPSGAAVFADYKFVGNGKCDGRDEIHCMMVHPYPVGEWIKVTRID